MTGIYGMAQGALFRDPETKTAKNGNPYVTATLKVESGDLTIFVRATIFSQDARDELADVRAGDVVCVVGRIAASTYERQGETRIGYSIVADRAIALKKPPKPKSNKAAPASRAAGEPHRGTRPIDPAAVARHAHWAAPEPPLLAMAAAAPQGQGGAPFDDPLPF